MEQGILDKTVNAREIFVTMGCALFPYQRIKELCGGRERVNFLDIFSFPIDDNEKVITIQNLKFFGDPFNRIMALRYARLTFELVGHELNDEERTLAQEALTLLEGYVLANKSEEEVAVMQQRIRDYLQANLMNKDYATHKIRIGCLENILSVPKQTALNAVVESSSIQRDVLGDAFATRQLEEIKNMAFRLHAH